MSLKKGRGGGGTGGREGDKLVCVQKGKGGGGVMRPVAPKKKGRKEREGGVLCCVVDKAGGGVDMRVDGGGKATAHCLLAKERGRKRRTFVIGRRPWPGGGGVGVLKTEFMGGKVNTFSFGP